jgi:hypothetical protein
VYIEDIHWGKEAIEHIRMKHQITPEEAEEVFKNKPYIRKGKNNLYYAFGITVDGRYLFIVFRYTEGIVIPITARDMTQSERRLYKRR